MSLGTQGTDHQFFSQLNAVPIPDLFMSVRMNKGIIKDILSPVFPGKI